MRHFRRAIALLLLTLFSQACVSLVDAARENNMPEVKRILEGGANPNGPRDACYSPLMIAAVTNNLALAQMLLDKGAKVNLRSPQCYHHGSKKLPIRDNTALMFSRTPEMATLLLSKGADMNAVNSNKNNALDESARNLSLDMVKFLFEKGLRPANARITFFSLGLTYSMAILSSFPSQGSIEKAERSFRIAEYLIQNGVKPTEMPSMLEPGPLWEKYDVDHKTNRMVLLYRNAGARSGGSGEKQ